MHRALAMSCLEVPSCNSPFSIKRVVECVCVSVCMRMCWVSPYPQEWAWSTVYLLAGRSRGRGCTPHIHGNAGSSLPGVQPQWVSGTADGRMNRSIEARCQFLVHNSNDENPDILSHVWYGYFAASWPFWWASVWSRISPIVDPLRSWLQEEKTFHERGETLQSVSYISSELLSARCANRNL